VEFHRPRIVSRVAAASMAGLAVFAVVLPSGSEFCRGGRLSVVETTSFVSRHQHWVWGAGSLGVKCLSGPGQSLF